MLNQKHSYSKISSLIPVKNEFKSQDLKILWKEHEITRAKLNETYHQGINHTQGELEFSYMDLKIELADEILNNCFFCERRCMVNRELEMGVCRVMKPRIASEFLHMGEKTPLVPSHTIFFAGCNFQCVYCQNWDISQNPQVGVKLSEEQLAGIIDKRRLEGSRNVNFVGGDPTPNLPYILKTMRFTREYIPVVWNSNLYLSEDSMKLLDGFVDLYLTDFKYGNKDCALRLSHIPNYWNIVTRTHIMAQKSGDLIIRHLVLPNHLECCTKPLIKWIYNNLGKYIVLNIMGQYRPIYNAFNYEDINRFPYNHEIEEAKDYAHNLGFINLI